MQKTKPLPSERKTKKSFKAFNLEKSSSGAFFDSLHLKSKLLYWFSFSFFSHDVFFVYKPWLYQKFSWYAVFAWEDSRTPTWWILLWRWSFFRGSWARFPEYLWLHFFREKRDVSDDQKAFEKKEKSLPPLMCSPVFWKTCKRRKPLRPRNSRAKPAQS